MTTKIPTEPNAPTVDLSPSGGTAVSAAPNAAPDAQDPATVVVRAGSSPTPLPESPIDAPLVSDEQVHLTLAAMETAMRQLPLDDDLPTPKAVEANYVRRSSLNAYISRLRVDHQRLRQLEPTLVMLRDWVETLQSATQDLTADLEEVQTLAQRGVVGGPSPIRAEQKVNNIRYALHDIAHGPDLVGGNEFMFEVLAKWFTDHHISPLPGESGIFAGRGGLHSATARLKDTKSALALARADLENSLAAAQELIPGEAGRGYTVDPLTGVHPKMP